MGALHKILLVSMTLFFAAPAHAQDANQIQIVSQTELVRIDRSHEVYSWQFEAIHIRTPIYCSDQCACVSAHIRKVLGQTFVGLPTRIITLYSTGMPLIMKATNYSAQFDYHRAVVVDLDGVQWVIDPILTGDARLVPYTEWIQHFSGYKF